MIYFVYKNMQKYWINVISKERVLAAVAEGVMQSQDNEAHLNRMKKGDWVVFYSPRTDIEGVTKLQSFTAIGQIADHTIYPVEKAPTLKIFRRKMDYVSSKETPLIPLIQHLLFIVNKKHWGTVFKLSLIQIPDVDFQYIAKQMGFSLPEYISK